MKYKIKLSLIGSLTLASICFLLSRPEKESAINQLMMENIEAIAEGENDTSLSCSGIGSLICPTSDRKVLRLDLYNKSLKKQ